VGIVCGDAGHKRTKQGVGRRGRPTVKWTNVTAWTPYRNLRKNGGGRSCRGGKRGKGMARLGKTFDGTFNRGMREKNGGISSPP